MIYRYRIGLRPLGVDQGDGWLAEAPVSDGDTPQQAIENLMD
jgi:hypothetical protein